MSHKVEHNKKALLQALEKTRGIVTTACAMAGVGRTSYYEYYRNDSVFKSDVDNLSDVALDFAESKLFEKMEGITMGKMVQGEMVTYSVPPSDTALIFYLKTKGKHRGYIESHRVEYTNDTPTPVSREEVEESIKKISAMMEGKLTVTKKTA